METETKRSLAEGTIAGAVAGAVLVMTPVCAALVTGHNPVLPLQISASVLLGPEALTEPPLASIIVGNLVAVTFAMYFGLVYGAIVAALKPRWRSSWVAETGLGAAFGIVVWFVTIQLAGRWMYPWVTETPQLAEAALFACAFGVPLGICVAIGEHMPRREAAAH